VNSPSVNRDTIFSHLILALLHIREELLRDLGEVSSFDIATSLIMPHQRCSTAAGKDEAHLSVLRKISRSRDSPRGLYYRTEI